MKILVLCADYPDLNGGISLNYVHTRNVSYITKWKVDVTVLNFRTPLIPQHYNLTLFISS